MKISKEAKRIIQILAILITLGGVVYITATAKMDMGHFSGNGR